MLVQKTLGTLSVLLCPLPSLASRAQPCLFQIQGSDLNFLLLISLVLRRLSGFPKVFLGSFVFWRCEHPGNKQMGEGEVWGEMILLIERDTQLGEGMGWDEVGVS